MSSVLTFNDADFTQRVAMDDTPVLVDFWAGWCGICRMLSPALDVIADEHAGQLRVAKVDVEANPETAARFEVSGLPTLVLLADGEPVKRFEGSIRVQKLRDDLRDYLG